MKPIGLGTSPLGGLFSELDEATARATVDRAWEVGIRHFDTAPLYGSGLSERRLGAALRARPRDEFVLSTKVGKLLVPGLPDPLFKGALSFRAAPDFSPEGMMRSLNESIARMGLDHVDLVLVHDPEDHMEEAMAGIAALRGSASKIGVGTNQVETALAFTRAGLVDVVLLAGRHTLLDRSAAESFLPLAAERNVEVIAAGVFNSGILAGGATYDYGPAPQKVVETVERIRVACTHHGVPLAAAAIQFALRHPAIARVVVGARSPAEVQENVDLAAVPIPEEFWDDEALLVVPR